MPIRPENRARYPADWAIEYRDDRLAPAEDEGQLAVAGVHEHPVAGLELALEQLQRQSVDELLLDHAAQLGVRRRVRPARFDGDDDLLADADVAAERLVDAGATVLATAGSDE